MKFITKIFSMTCPGVVLFLSLAGCGSGGDGFLEPGSLSSGSGPINTRPVAKAGADQAISSGVTVTLEGSQSSDDEGTPLTYSWQFEKKPAGSSAVLSDPAAVNPSFRADRAGLFTLSLEVSDGTLTSYPDTVDVSAKNDPPVADAGPDQNANVGNLVTLDGSASSDPNGDDLTYHWTLQKPFRSQAALSNSNAVKPTFTPDMPGIYTVYLYVSDGDANYWDELDVNVSMTGVADAGPDQYSTSGPMLEIKLDGSGSYDTSSETVHYSWSLKRKPVGSTVTLSDPSSVCQTFTADLEGKYELSLQLLHNGYVNSAADTVIVVVITNRPVAQLVFKVIDAEYSRQMDRIIAVSGTPSNQVDIYDPVANLDEVVYLSAVPTSVSVSPDGLHAAVGHNGSISYVELVSKAVTTTWTVNGNIKDIVLAGNGYIYAVPEQAPLLSVNVDTGDVATHAASFGYMKAIKLHPSGKAIYADAVNRILKFDISSGTPVYLYSSSLPGMTYLAGGDLWMMEDGTGFVVKYGNIFPASEGSTFDMIRKASLYMSLQHAVHSSAAASLAVIPSELSSVEDTEVQIFDDQLFGLQKFIALPDVNAGSHYQAHGKFVFYDSTGTNMFVVVQADTSTVPGVSYDFGVVKY